MLKTSAISVVLPCSVNGRSSSPTDPLILQQSHADENLLKQLEEIEMDGTVYKQTVNTVEVKEPRHYVGLTKEELGRYVNDPSWRRIRFLFLGLFWLIWLILLCSALLIVLLGPKCAPKPHLHWYQKKLCYQVWTRSFQDGDNDGIGDLAGMASRLRQMAALKASALWPVPLLQSKGKSGYDVVDHRAIDPDLGTMRDFEHLINVAHKHDIAFIMDLPLTTVSIDHDWFFKSVAKMVGFEQFFRWTDDPIDTRSYSSTPGHVGYYMHWDGRPEFPLLNFDYGPVRESLKQVAKFWLDKGVDGFYLPHPQYLSFNADGTANWANIHAYLKDFNEFIRKASPGRAILTFTSSGLNGSVFGHTLDDFKLQMRVKSDMSYVINNELVFVNGSCESRCLHHRLQRVIEHHTMNNMSWPMWEVGHPYVSRIASRMGSRQRAEMLFMLLMTLPGSVNLYYGDEIGMLDSSDPTVLLHNRPRAPMQWSDAPNAGFTEGEKSAVPVNPDFREINAKALSNAKHSILSLFKRLATLRRTEDALIHGELKLAPVNDDLLILHAKTIHSSTSYLTVLNFAGKNVYNVLDVPYNLVIAPDSEVTLVVATTNLAKRNVYQRRKVVDLERLELQKNEGVVIRIKPAKS